MSLNCSVWGEKKEKKVGRHQLKASFNSSPLTTDMNLNSQDIEKQLETVKGS